MYIYFNFFTNKKIFFITGVVSFFLVILKIYIINLSFYKINVFLIFKIVLKLSENQQIFFELNI